VVFDWRPDRPKQRQRPGVRRARLILLLLALAWMTLVIAAPTVALGAPVSALTYAFGSFICHQRPERSFHLAEAQLPVCARCFGLYAGATIGAVWAFRHRLASLPALRTLLVVAALPTAITWAIEAAGLWSPANVVRFAAALPLGVAAAVTVNYLECAQPPRIGPSSPRIPI
jgi:uncharacterized membrane protein